MAPEAPQKANGGYNAGKIVSSVIAGLLALYGVTYWWNFVSLTASGYKSSGIDGQLVAWLFAMWFIPTVIATAVVCVGFGIRSVTSKIAIGVEALLLITAVVTAATGAQ
ncbi:hypothetical protein HUO13_02465 [Saccharopolyspora erythraea]|uniref:hypothetical protein n=1 Tax=Saccharopolyspora erythraea TaxID=1836 RepID=UPI001BA6C85C|nr:hypothetical protein [Saccharopolyspora erythraea]QUG99814.1 hypothetical protein HUO13_02465 [Saccharopolyspora erythraea]